MDFVEIHKNQTLIPTYGIIVLFWKHNCQWTKEVEFDILVCISDAVVQGWTAKVITLTLKLVREWIVVWVWDGFELLRIHFFSYIMGALETIHKKCDVL